MKSTTQPLKDGIVKIYEVKNIAESGNMPKDGLTLKASLRYDERTVGVTRYRLALQDQEKIELMIRVPRLDIISAQDIAVPNDGKQYKIVQRQHPVEVSPPMMDLSLERVDADYEIE